jgi:hypothetical protein
MREFGFSTGALAKGDFRSALQMLRGIQTKVVELSALRQSELPELAGGFKDLDLKSFSYISVHAPSSIKPDGETEVVDRLKIFRDTKWPIVVHPDTIRDTGLWKDLSDQLCIENNDLRKPFGRKVAELKEVFSCLPEATFCCDLGHARQVDPTMSEAAELLKTFATRLRQLHVSEVNTRSTHERISAAAAKAFSKIYHLIPDEVPVILETPVSADDIESEIEQVRNALPSQDTNRREMVEGSLDILWTNYGEHSATPQYALHFLRYRGFKDGAQRTKTISSQSALTMYLRDLNLTDPQIRLILNKIDTDKFFDVPNIFLPKTLARAYEQ